jgi:NAD(P)-dependent dehydrogenase (short-subunit alcohol dehydrogenase family)
MPAAQLLGLAFGPLAASFVVIGDEARPVALVSFVFALVSAVLVWAGRKYWEQADPMAHERYTGKTVLIAGASSGMGRALALRLAEEGAHLVVTARRKERLEELSREVAERGGHCLALAADAGDPDNAAGVVAAAVERFGRIDLAVLNIGGAPALDMRTMSARDVMAYMRSNYDTIVNYLFPVINQMSAQRGGVIAHTNSLAGFLGVPLQGPYSAAKGALRLLFDTCRVEFGDRGIHFVSIYPGFIATEATANDGMPAPREISEDLAVEHLLTAIRQQRWDYAFPVSTSLLVKLAGLLPKPVTARILKSDYRTQHENLLSMKAAGTLKAR